MNNKEDNWSNYIAKSIIRYSSDAQVDLKKLENTQEPDKVKSFLVNFTQRNQKRIQTVWRIYLVLTIILFIVLVVSIIAFIYAIVKGISVTAFISGGFTIGSFLSTIIWKPQSKLAAFTEDLNRLEQLNFAIDMLFDSINGITDNREKVEKTKEAVQIIKDYQKKGTE